MKKLIIIFILSIIFNFIGLKNRTLYPYVSDFYCTWERVRECTSVTTAKGFPLGYIPYQPDTSFDDLNFEINYWHYLLNLIFYYFILHNVYNIYKKVKNHKSIKNL